MKYKEYIALNQPFYIDIKNEFEFVFDYFENAFFNLEIKYELTDFERLIKVFVVDNYVGLTAIKNIIDLKPEDLKLESLGKINAGVNVVENSYVGYGSEGTQSKNTNNIESKSYSIVSALKAIKNNNLLSVFEGLKKQYLKLFNTIYKLVV